VIQTLTLALINSREIGSTDRFSNDSQFFGSRNWRMFEGQWRLARTGKMNYRIND
jgi:hypothetical protein